jgi:hypothetical protein
LLHRSNNGVVGHVRECHNGAIVGWRQIAIVDATEAPSSGPAKMKEPHGLRSIDRQQWQHAQAIEYLLSVRLENFSPQTLGRASGLVQHDGADPLLRQCQG